MTEKRVKWVCPHCNHLHFWYWDEDDIFEGETNMNCEGCGIPSKQMMHVDPISGNAWCEVIKNTMTEPKTSFEKKIEEHKKEQERIMNLKAQVANAYWDKQIKWTCPKCNYENNEWEKNIQKGEHQFECNNCFAKSDVYVHIDLITGNGLGIPMELIEKNQENNCEFVKEQSITKETKDYLNSKEFKKFVDNFSSKTELEQLKEQAKKIQQKIDYLEEVEKQKKENKSLHNVIAKWEFYYSERLDKRRTEYLRGVEKGLSYRDILEEEIENLLNEIEEWIDDVTGFPLMTYEPEYWSGWDECKKTLKSKLRGPCDFYEISKVNNHYE